MEHQKQDKLSSKIVLLWCLLVSLVFFVGIGIGIIRLSFSDARGIDYQPAFVVLIQQNYKLYRSIEEKLVDINTKLENIESKINRLEKSSTKETISLNSHIQGEK